MSCGIFTTNVRNKVNAWQPIGLIPKLTSSSQSEIKSLTPYQKESEYHADSRTSNQLVYSNKFSNFGGNQFTLNKTGPMSRQCHEIPHSVTPTPPLLENLSLAISYQLPAPLVLHPTMVKLRL